MATPALTYPELRALSPCNVDFKRVTRVLGGAKTWDGRKISARRARMRGVGFADIVWAASAVARREPDVRRRLRLWLADCAAHVLHIYEADLSADDRPRNAIRASRAFARGRIGDAAIKEVRNAAFDAALREDTVAGWAVSLAVASDVVAIAATAARAAVKAAAGAADPAWAAACRAEEEAWQFDRLVAWLSDKEPSGYPLPRKRSKKR